MKNQKNSLNHRTIYVGTNKNIEGVVNLNLLGINYFDVEIDLNRYDALVFTSKNGVLSLKKYDLHNVNSYAISTVTANFIKDSGGNVVYTGIDGHGDKFAYELIEKLQGKKVLYIRAKEVVSNLVNILKSNNIDCDEIITYETKCEDNLDIKNIDKNGIIIFSSPSTVKCFLKKYSWDNTYHAIAIGDTTASYFPEYFNYLVSSQKTLKSCIELAKTL